MEVSELISQTVAAGVPSLELKYLPIRDCRSKNPSAYRTSLEINSIELGHLKQGEYTPLSDQNDVGIRVFERALEKAVTDRKAFAASGRNPKFISVHCPVSALKQPDFCERVKKITGNKKEGQSDICLEFSDDLLFEPSAQKSILDLKLIDVKSMLVCSKSDTCAFFKLTDIPVDYVLLSSTMTRMSTDRNKPTVISSLVQFLQSMNISVIADAADNSEQIRLFARLECDFYIAADENIIPFDEAVLQKEDED